MIIAETKNINGREFLYGRSDLGVYIMDHSGNKYEDAYDPIVVANDRTYEETDEKIPEDLSEEERVIDV